MDSVLGTKGESREISTSSHGGTPSEASGKFVDSGPLTGQSKAWIHCSNGTQIEVVIP